MFEKLKKFSPLIITLLVVVSCQSEVERVSQVNKSKFEDEEIIKIYDLVDKRDTKSLLTYLTHDNVDYRYEAALGLGSVQDSLAIGKLSYALKDESPRVRKAAAYALGQTGDSSAIIPIFNALNVEDSLYVRRELLESLGKVITQPQLSKLQYWGLKTEADSTGMAWGLYRAGLRNVFDSVSVGIAIRLLDENHDYETRLGAAHFLSRTSGLNLTPHISKISASALKDKSPFVRMASVLAFRNINSETAKDTILAALKDPDYRVRINALRVSGEFNIDISTIMEMLDDENINVCITAANMLSAKLKRKDVDMVNKLLSPETNHRVKGTLYGALLKLSDDHEAVIATIESEYAETEDVYYKAYLLSALGETIEAYDFVVTETFEAEHRAVSSAGMMALANMRSLETFPDDLKTAFNKVLQQAIETKDIALIAVASSVMISPEYELKSEMEDVTFLKRVRDQLSLPKDMEAIQSIDRAIAHFNDEEYQAPANEYNHPIDWEQVKEYSSEPKALIKTEKGDIKLRLFMHKSPGSVLNFISLANDQYFNGKNFHRVVPNFVIQGGCNRGDGYGGEAYSIRSELSDLNYEEGTVGMASAGKDTEGTQWFISHSPTPHLDGRYTIFAKVTEGMDIVHRIEVGDEILSVTIEP